MGSPRLRLHLASCLKLAGHLADTLSCMPGDCQLLLSGKGRMKIIEALKSVAGETDATVDAMIQVLADNRFGADDPADGAFCGLSESALKGMGLDHRQVAAIQQVQRKVTQGELCAEGNCMRQCPATAVACTWAAHLAMAT